jgi:general secretion pathway protein D
MNMLKTMLDSKALFIDEKARLLVMRDSPEVVRMAEKLMGSLDMPEAEVMLEVEVLEVQRSRLSELGIKYPTQMTLSAGAIASGGTGAAAAFTLEQLLRLTKGDIITTPLSATANFKKDVTAADILASPRIRARSREKAKILIGDRVPVITNSVTPTVGQPVVTGQVQYIEVGLKLDVEPIVYRDNDVSIKMTMEVSSIVREITQTNGSLAYQIGTRTAATLLQLKDGETQVLAGLISDDEREVSSRIPGLGDLPMIGRLFSTQRDERKKSELVLSITPHVVRSVPHADPAVAEFMYGSDSIRGGSLALKSSDDFRGSLSQPQAVEPSPAASPTMAPARPGAPSSLFTPPPTVDPNVPLPKNEPPPQQEQPDASGTDTGVQ